MTSKFDLMNVITLLLLVSAASITAPAKALVAVFDITNYGAKQNADATQAIMSAWKEACVCASPSKIVVPKGTFNLGVIRLNGPCKAPIELNVEGMLHAPKDLGSFKGADGWVYFAYIDQFTMSGHGVFDGQGKLSWAKNDCNINKKCATFPANMRFNFLSNSTVKDVTSKDSKNFHVNVLGCKNLTFQNFKISAPSQSVNTDGIHIGRSNEINITDTIIETGDDCISIGDGAQNVHIERVTCGPGHGISIGSLGKYKNEDDVVGITVNNCTLINTDNGVRIKTWPSSEPGVATDLHFEHIIMNNVANPVIIDQEYCPWNQCNLGAPSRVKISNVSFKDISGTTVTKEAVKFICSKTYPCQNVKVGDINLKYNGSYGPVVAVCQNLKATITKPFPDGCTP